MYLFPEHLLLFLKIMHDHTLNSHIKKINVVILIKVYPSFNLLRKFINLGAVT